MYINAPGELNIGTDERIPRGGTPMKKILTSHFLFLRIFHVLNLRRFLKKYLKLLFRFYKFSLEKDNFSPKELAISNLPAVFF